MATRSTVSSVWSSFLARMQALASGQSPAFADVVEGEVGTTHYEHPFLAVKLLSATVSSRADEDKEWKCKVQLRIVAEQTTADSAATVALGKISAVEDQIDGFTKPDGSAGWENAEWSLTFSITSEEGNLVQADNVRDFTVMVARGAN